MYKAGASADLNKLLAQQIFARSVRDYFDHVDCVCYPDLLTVFITVYDECGAQASKG